MQLSTPAPNTITQSLTATGTIQWAAGSLFYLPEGLLVEAVFVSEGEAVQEGDKIAALRREDVEQMSNYKVLLDTGMTLKGSRKYFSKAKLEFYRGR